MIMMLIIIFSSFFFDFILPVFVSCTEEALLMINDEVDVALALTQFPISLHIMFPLRTL